MQCLNADLLAVMQLKFGGGDGATTLSVASALASNIGGFLGAVHHRLWSKRATSDCIQVFAARPSCVLRTCYSRGLQICLSAREPANWQFCWQCLTSSAGRQTAPELLRLVP